MPSLSFALQALAAQHKAEASAEPAQASGLPAASDASEQDTSAASEAVHALTSSNGASPEQPEAAVAKAVGVQLEGRMCKRRQKQAQAETDDSAEQPQLVAA